MTRGAVEAYTSNRASFWLGRAIAFRTAADTAKGYSVSPFCIRDMRLSMRTAAYKMRAELLIERMDRRAVA